VLLSKQGKTRKPVHGALHKHQDSVLLHCLIRVYPYTVMLVKLAFITSAILKIKS